MTRAVHRTPSQGLAALALGRNNWTLYRLASHWTVAAAAVPPVTAQSGGAVQAAASEAAWEGADCCPSLKHPGFRWTEAVSLSLVNEPNRPQVLLPPPWGDVTQVVCSQGALETPLLQSLTNGKRTLSGQRKFDTMYLTHRIAVRYPEHFRHSSDKSDLYDFSRKQPNCGKMRARHINGE